MTTKNPIYNRFPIEKYLKKFTNIMLYVFTYNHIKHQTTYFNIIYFYQFFSPREEVPHFLVLLLAN